MALMSGNWKSLLADGCQTKTSVWPVPILIGHNAIVFLVAHIFKANQLKRGGIKQSQRDLAVPYAFSLLDSATGPKAAVVDYLAEIIYSQSVSSMRRSSYQNQLLLEMYLAACLISLQRLKNCLLSLLFSPRLCLIMTPC